MSEILDRVFPEPDGEWIGAKLFVQSDKSFNDFVRLTNRYDFTEKTAAKIALQNETQWPEDIRFKLRGHRT